MDDPLQRAPLSPELMSRAGYVAAADMSASRSRSELPLEIVQRFERDEALRRDSAALVNACVEAAPAAASPQAVAAGPAAAPVVEAGPANAAPVAQFTTDRRPLAVVARLASAPARMRLTDAATQTVRSVAPNSVTADVAFTGGATGTATYTVSAEGQGAKVEVRLARAAGEVAPVRLRETAEAAARLASADLARMPNVDFAGLQFDVITPRRQSFAYLPMITAQNETVIRTAVGQSVEAIGALAASQGASISGQPIAVRVSAQGGEARFRAGIAFDGARPANVTGVQFAETPYGTALRVHYRGPVAGVAQAHQQLAALAAATRLRPGQAYEFYLENLSAANAPADREIYLPVTGDLAGVQRIAAARR